MIKAIIFDMDGLMFDTERLDLELFKKLCESQGYNILEAELFQLLGVSSQMVEKFKSKYPRILEIRKICDQEFDAYFYEKFPHPGDANKPGLEELYCFLRKKGYKIAIASSSREAHIRELVSYCGFTLQPDAIVSAHEGIPSKPAPDVFLEAAKQLKVSPEECLVLEDSKQGTLAAYRAGMRRVMIPDLVDVDEEIRPYVDFRCDSLMDVISILESL